MLAIAPMNQGDRAAEPMFDAFTNHPDLTPYNVLPNQVPLTLGLAGSTTASVMQRTSAAPFATTTAPQPLSGIFRQWVSWSKRQDFGKPDQANPAQLNHIDWYSATGWTRPYPGEKRILPPDLAPGRNLASQDIGEG